MPKTFNDLPKVASFEDITSTLEFVINKPDAPEDVVTIEIAKFLQLLDASYVKTQTNAELKSLQLLSPDANNSILSSSGFSLTGANNNALIDLAGTWNTTGTPTGIRLNITDTASNAASLLLDLQVGGTSMARISKGGRIFATSSLGSTVPGFAFANEPNSGIGLTAATGGNLAVCLRDSTLAIFGGNGHTSVNTLRIGVISLGQDNLILSRADASVLQLGENHATVGTSQTIKAHNVTTGRGARLILSGGNGTTDKGGVEATDFLYLPKLTAANVGSFSPQEGGEIALGNVNSTNGWTLIVWNADDFNWYDMMAGTPISFYSP